MALAQERIVDGDSPAVKRTRSRRHAGSSGATSNHSDHDPENMMVVANVVNITHGTLDDVSAIIPKKRGRKSNKQRLEQQQQQAALAAEEMMSGLPELSTAAAASGAYVAGVGTEQTTPTGNDGFVGFGDFFYAPHDPEGHPGGLAQVPVGDDDIDK